MQLPPKRKPAPASDRRDVLRKARAAAPTLRTACPEAAVVRVELAFDSQSQPVHAPQTFSLYPPAKAHFVFACPFGDCDGAYDLNSIAFDALQAGKRRTRGRLTCSGHRARDGKSANACELAATYSITVRLEKEESAVARDVGGPSP
jgi:hypothetical protein